ncbi:MAG: amidase [Alphaproteobacteria bacterium]|nr:amidase [Alphaproteobacteria bacterium]
MSFKEYVELDGIALGALIVKGEVSAAEAVEAAIERIAAVDGRVNAVCIEMYEEARRVARAPLPAGPFAGVPFLLKDLHALYAGFPTTNGSRFWVGNVADHDSTIVARYRSGGLAVVGKSNSTELGLACETAPVLYGATRNPYDLTLSAGGSSGGAAAAVAAREVPIAHATDGGGSIRIPSAMCGTFGLKVSRARNPFGPDLGEGWNGLSVGHAITRTVRDSAALLDLTQGPEIGMPYACPAPERPFLDEVGRDPGRLRIAFCSTDLEGGAIHPDVAEAVVAAARLLERLGHDVVETRPDLDMAGLKRATRILVGCNIRNVLNMRVRAIGREPAHGDVERITELWSKESLTLTGADYAWAVTTIHRVGRALGHFFEKHDLFLTATFASPPLPINTIDMMSDDLDAYYAGLRKHSAFTSLYNAAGCPAANVPVHWRADGLPLGVQLGARLGGEATILRVAAQLEQAQPWHHRRPAGL